MGKDDSSTWWFRRLACTQVLFYITPPTFFSTPSQPSFKHTRLHTILSTAHQHYINKTSHHNFILRTQLDRNFLRRYQTILLKACPWRMNKSFAAQQLSLWALRKTRNPITIQTESCTKHYFDPSSTSQTEGDLLPKRQLRSSWPSFRTRCSQI